MRLRYSIPLTVIAVLFVITMFIGSSYSLWKVTEYQQTENVIRTGCFELAFTEQSSSINLTNTYPMSDERGLKTTPYLFTLTNTCDIDASFSIYLNTFEAKNGETKIGDQYIKYIIENTNDASSVGQKLSSAQENTDISNFQYEAGNKIATSYEIYPDTSKGKTDLKPGESASFSFRLWIDESAKNTKRDENGKIIVQGIDGQTFEAAISTVAYAKTNQE